MVDQDLKGSALKLISRAEEVMRRPQGLQTLPTSYAFATGMYHVRSRPLFKGIGLLIQEDLVSEALVLSRPLFTESLRLNYLAASPADREALLLGFANKSIGEKLGLVQEAVARGIEDDPSSALDSLEEQRKQVLGYQRRRQIPRLRHFPSERQMAERLSRQEDLWTYSYLSEFVHGSEIAHSSRRDKGDDDTYRFFDSHVNHDETPLVAAFAAKAMLIAHDSYSKIVGWPPSLDVYSLLNEISEMLYPA